jgi:hypothetical protein
VTINPVENRLAAGITDYDFRNQQILGTSKSGGRNLAAFQKKNLFPQTSCNKVGGNAVVTVTTDPPADFFENKEWKEQEFVTDKPLLR